MTAHRFARAALSLLAAARLASAATNYVSVTVTSRVIASIDDAEQTAATGQVYTDSSDLEIIDDSSFSGMQSAVGLRFCTNLSIPQGSTISSAYITFTTDEVDTAPVDARIFAENSDDAAEFTTANYAPTDRAWTGASVKWAPIS